MRAPKKLGASHVRFAHRERPRLVKDDGFHLARALQRVPAFDEDAVRGADAGADHNRRRRRESERTRARGNEDGDAKEHRKDERALLVGEPAFGVGARLASHEPAEPREKGEGDDDRDEDGRDAVGEGLNGRLAQLRRLDELHNLRERRVRTDARGAHEEASADVDRAARDHVADVLRHRERFARKHSLVHVRGALLKHSVGGDARPREHLERVAALDERRVNLALAAGVVDEDGGRGRQLHELRDRLGRLALGAPFEALSEEDEGDEHGGRVEKVDVVRAVHHDAVRDGEDAHAVRSGRGKHDEHVHVGAAPLKRRPRPAVEALPDVELHHAREDKLEQRRACHERLAVRVGDERNHRDGTQRGDELAPNRNEDDGQRESG
mmetsp:Transcript_2228/g.8077  ORF Transcript_2228/g.8077 Transcript_2228/m.8077 type:complete len:382 (-) Transcript_2228:863-2008(-)